MTNDQRDAITELRIQGNSCGVIAQKLNLSRDSVKAYCRRNGLGGRAKDIPRNMSYVTHCKNCGAKVTQKPKRKKKLFCCDACRRQWWYTHRNMLNQKTYYNFICKNCGKEFSAYGNSKRKYCCHECYIQDRFGNCNTRIF